MYKPIKLTQQELDDIISKEIARVFAVRNLVDRIVELERLKLREEVRDELIMSEVKEYRRRTEAL